MKSETSSPGPDPGPSIIPERLGRRGYLFRFDGSNSPFPQLTITYVIVGERRVFVCDTHTGPTSMEPVRAFLSEHAPGKPVVVVNTHSDWDHVWGNAAFEDATVVAHSRCRHEMAEDELWEWALESFGEARNGEVVRRLPDLVFERELGFPEEGVTLFHSPGHTADSLSVHDTVDGVVFVGDNLEAPLPYLQWHDLDAYRRTLRDYRTRGATRMLASHSGVVEVELLEATLTYLDALSEGREPTVAGEEAEGIHRSNRTSLVVSLWQERARQLLGESFSLKEFMQDLNQDPPLDPNQLSQFLSDKYRSG